jgi:hypothetical protein
MISPCSSALRWAIIDSQAFAKRHGVHPQEGLVDQSRGDETAGEAHSAYQLASCIVHDVAKYIAA